MAGLLVAGMAFPLVGGVGLVTNDASDTVSATSTDLAAGQLPLVTTVTDRPGAPIAYLYDQNRQNTPLEQISPDDAGGDRRHRGPAVLRARRRRLARARCARSSPTSRPARRQQGASTLTQQYVKNYQLYVTAQTASERLKATEADLRPQAP